MQVIDPPLNEVVALVMSTDPAAIDDESRMNVVEAWDSMQHIILMGVIEQTYGLKFSMDELSALDSVGKIRQAIAARKS